MMKNLKLLTLYGVILFCSGLILTILIWPYALAVVEADKAYPIASGIIFIIIFTGQLMSIVAISMFERCIETIGKVLLCLLTVIFYLIIWFSCGAGQLIVVVLMVINVDENLDTGAKAYGAIIVAVTIVYMLASSFYSTIVFIWFFHKWKQTSDSSPNQ